MDRGCGLCHLGAPAQPLFVAIDSVTGDRFEVVKCEACGLARTDPQPSTSELDRYYPIAYHHSAKRYLFGLDRTLSIVHRSRIRRIERLAGGTGRVLDIGCGPGWFLAQMRARGWETRGTERSSRAAQLARDLLNLDVRAQEISELVAEGEVFDAIVFWHVAEHVHDPAEVLAGIAHLLRPGGVLMIGVPNFGSPEARIGKGRWFHLDVPRHLYHFTPTTLEDLLGRAGIETREWVYIAPEYDIFSFIQTAQNRVGLPTNLLYDVLRRREARLAHPRARSVLSGIALAMAVPLTLIGLVWVPLAAALRRSATITIYAQRPVGDERP